MPIKYNAYKHIVCLVLPSSLYVIMLFHILMLCCWLLADDG